MRKMKKIAGLIMAAALAAGLAGCGGKESTGGGAGGSSGDTIKIAVAGPMTGDNAEYGIGFTNAAELMVKEWNEKGGVGKTD